MDPLEFWTICNANGILLSREQVESFERFHNELLYWNEKVNLISRKDIDNIWERHFLHSLSIVKDQVIPERAQCLDVGCGGGFPGIPVGIARPDINITLVDSIAKKIKLAGMFADHTGQRNFKSMTSRMEDLQQNKQHKQFYNIIMARAVAPITSLIGWTKPLLAVNGQYILLKGGNLTEEIADAKKSHPNLQIIEKQIDWKGIPWFKDEEKKLLICQFSP